MTQWTQMCRDSMQMRGDVTSTIVTSPMEINGNINRETLMEEIKEAVLYLNTQHKRNGVTNIVVPVTWRENNNWVFVWIPVGGKIRITVMRAGGQIE